MRPISATDFLREKSPRKTLGPPGFSSNRFNILRSESPAAASENGSYRERSLSVKRKHNNNASYANAAKRAASSTTVANSPLPDQSSSTVFDELETVEVNIAKVSSLCETVEAQLSEANFDPAIISTFGEIITALRYVTKIHVGLHKASQTLAGNLTSASANPSTRPPVELVSLGTVSRTTHSQAIPQTTQRIMRDATPVSEEDVAKNKFRDAVKEAEKATLIFNLDMGRVPIMNKDTMSKKATGSLIAMAAANEGNSNPSEDAVAAIDDLLSVTENISFFGATTKSYKHPTDPASAAFCTVPVKYTFRDKDTRARAENVLRSKCNVKCSTPYPAVLRECIKIAINSGKAARPGSFVRVNVDSKAFCLRLAWRAKSEQNWTNHPDAIPLPPAALDIKVRKAPDNLYLANLPVPIDQPMEDNNAAVPDGSAITIPPLEVRPTTRSSTRSPKGQATPRK